MRGVYKKFSSLIPGVQLLGDWEALPFYIQTALDPGTKAGWCAFDGQGGWEGCNVCILRTGLHT